MCVDKGCGTTALILRPTTRTREGLVHHAPSATTERGAVAQTSRDSEYQIAGGEVDVDHADVHADRHVLITVER